MRVRWNLCRRKAGEVLGDQGAPPIDVKRLAEDQGIQIIEDDLEEISGFIAREDDVIVIGVNDTQSAARQRFTIAHELGHFFLHGVNQTFVDKMARFRNAVSSQASDPFEIEANTFAAELLMPETLLLKTAEKVLEENPDLGYAEDLVRILAQEFEVSEQAMNFRLTKLGIIDSESYT